MKDLKRYGLHVSIPVLLTATIIYAMIYKQLTSMNHNSFKGLYHDSVFWDFLYYSFNTISTTGFGDIHPLTEAAKVITVTEIITGIIIMVGMIVYVALSHVRNK